jgi:sarcosine oxidase, subunit beta
MEDSVKPLSRRRFVKLGGGITAGLALGGVGGARSWSDADVILVGAGSFGCNTAWHLHKRGLKVIVLDAQASSATQASRAGAGFVANWSAVHVPSWGKTEWEMQQYGINFYTNLERDRKQDIGFAACGIAYIYLTPQGWHAVQTRITRARSYGTKLEVVDSGHAEKLLPPINFKSTVGILFDPGSIRLRAADAIRSIADQLAQEGVQFKYNTPVNSFVLDGDRVVGVKTDGVEYRASNVIVTAGAWSRRLLKTVHAACPTNAKADSRYTTEPLEGLQPTLPLMIYSDVHGFYIRYERKGLLIGGDDQPVDPNNPPFANQIPKDGAYRVRDQVREIENVMPLLKHAEVDGIASGVATYTEDQHFIADAVPAFKGLYVITACQEAGITHGPALGRMMTELVVDGGTTLDRGAYRLNRFKGDSARTDPPTAWGRKHLMGLV